MSLAGRAAIVALLGALACNGNKGAPEAAATLPTSQPASPESKAKAEAEAVGFDLGPAGAHLLISAERLEQLKRRARAGDRAYEALEANANAYLAAPQADRSSAENLAVMALVSGEERYCRGAHRLAEETMKADVRRDSYLYFGDHMRAVAMVLDACRAVLSAEERAALADYLDRSTNELWFANRGHGWGLDDPGNNYFMAFVEGTAFAGYALVGERDESSKKYLALVRSKIEGRILPYLDERARGGDWPEGANYGQRSKQRLFSAAAVIASMGGPNYFEQSAFFKSAVLYALYQLQPDLASLHPSGDLARDAAMKASPFDRDYLLMAVQYLRDDAIRGYGQWYLERVVPSMSHGDFTWRQGLFRDFVFASPEVKARSPEDLPKSYLAPGTGFVNIRTGWDRDASSLTIAASALIDQSHAHFDTGSFTWFKNGWQALDAASLSRSGLTWQAGAHNMVTVDGHERRLGPAGKGLLHFEHREATLAYLQIDASDLFRQKKGGEAPMIGEYTRELVFLEPSTLVVFDRVEPKAGARYHLRVHLAEKPTPRGKGFVASHGGGSLAYEVVIGGESRVAADDDLAEGPSHAFRIETAPGDRRFLSVAEVAKGPPPKLAPAAIRADGNVAGVVVGSRVVVFSNAARGAPVGAFSYRVEGEGPYDHIFVNLEPETAYSVRLKKAGKATVVEVSPGGREKSSAHGLLRVSK